MTGMESNPARTLNPSEPFPTLPPLNGLAIGAEILNEQDRSFGKTTVQPSPEPAKMTLGPKKSRKTLVDLGAEMGLPRSVSTVIDDMQEAVLGIVSDLTGKTKERVSLAEVLTYKNRLRGIGMLLILVASVALLLEALVGDSL